MYKEVFYYEVYSEVQLTQRCFSTDVARSETNTSNRRRVCFWGLDYYGIVFKYKLCI